MIANKRTIQISIRALQASINSKEEALNRARRKLADSKRRGLSLKHQQKAVEVLTQDLKDEERRINLVTDLYLVAEK